MFKNCGVWIVASSNPAMLTPATITTVGTDYVYHWTTVGTWSITL